MKNLFLKLASLVSWHSSRGLDEQYLAQAVDAHDFEIRQRALERARP